jgi:urease accessory protein
MSEWLTWQLVDSSLPTGAFAHSSGLEAAWRRGEIPDSQSLRAFLDASIQQTGYASLPLVNDAHRDPSQLDVLDERAEAFLLNTVANRASRIQGRSLAATAARIWPVDGLIDLQGRIANLRAHVAPVSGAVFRTLGVSLSTTQRLVLYGAARGVLSAAVRLGMIGSFEAQEMQYASSHWLDEIAKRCATLSVDDLAHTAPLLDLMQAGHDRLYSRLFQS